MEDAKWMIMLIGYTFTELHLGGGTSEQETTCFTMEEKGITSKKKAKKKIDELIKGEGENDILRNCKYIMIPYWE